MATLTATIKWATNTAELATSLQKGVAQIEVTQEAAEKMVKTLAGIDGATKPAIASTSSLSDWFGTLGRQVVTTMAGFVSAQAIIGAVTTAWNAYIGFLKDSVKAFADAEAAQTTLTAALKAQHTLTPELVTQFNALAKEFQNTTVYSDDLITSMQALLVQVGGLMPSQMKAALQASVDLASGLGIDLQAATLLVAKAAAGHTETLGRYGVVVSDAALATKGFDAVLEAINRQFGGQAAAQAQTYSGSVAQMGNSWNNVQEAVGKYITENPVIQAALRTLSEDLKTADDKSGKFSASLEELATKGHLPGYGKIIGFLEAYIGHANEVANINARLLAMPSPFAKTAEDMQKMPDPGGLAYFKAMTAAEDAQHKVDAATKTTTLSIEDQNNALGIVAGNTAEETQKLIEVQGATDTWAMGIGQLNERVPDLTAYIEAQKQAFTDLTGEVVPLVTAFTDYEREVRAAQQAADSLQQTHALLSNTMGPVVTGVADMNHRLPEATKNVGALQRAFDAVQGVLGGIQTKFAQVAVVATNMAEGMIKSFGKGDWIGGLVAGITGGIQLITQLFHDAEKAINPMRAAFVDAAGGLDALRDKATIAGVTINALLNAKNAEQYKAAIDALNLAFEDHAKDISRAKELIDEYQLSTEQLGPKWRAQQLTEQVGVLTNDLRIMVDVLGLSMPDALVVMASKFQAAFNTAKQFGMELPAEMKPILQKMIELGLLTDSSGVKYTDLEQTGVKFAETFSASVDRLIAKFDEFLQRLGMVPGNMRTDIDVYTHHHDVYDNNAAVNAAHGGMVTAHGIQYLGSGGNVLPFRPRGSDTVPAMLTPGEEVIPVGGRAKEQAPVVAAIDRLGRTLMVALPLAVRDEVQKKVTGRR